MTTDEHLIFRAALATDAGRRRATNEDFVAGPEGVPGDMLDRKGSLYLVADGVGGYKGGARASRVAVETILQAYYGSAYEDPETSLREAIRTANRRVRELAQQEGLENMSCTLVAAVVLGGPRALIAHVGDSRAYLVRGQSIYQLTEDHSWVAEQVRQGVIAPKAARNHPYRHVITRSIGAAEDVESDTSWVDLQPGDRLVLCTDGLSDVVPDVRIGRLATKGDPQTAVQQLIAEANRNGGPDNISVCVVQVEPSSGKAPTGAFERSRRLPVYVVPVGLLVALLLFGSAAWLLWLWTASLPERETRAPSLPGSWTPPPLPLVAEETATPTPAWTRVPVGSPTVKVKREIIPSSTPTLTSTLPAVTATPTTERPLSKEYIVQWGDNLTWIACRYGTTVEAIVQANDLLNPNVIYPGQKLTIPTDRISETRCHVVQPGDNLSNIAVTYGTTVEAIVQANDLPNPNYIYVGQVLTIP